MARNDVFYYSVWYFDILFALSCSDNIRLTSRMMVAENESMDEVSVCAMSMSVVLLYDERKGCD